MEQMSVPRIEKTTGKFFDASWPDYTDTMLRMGAAKAAVDTANEDRLLKAQELEIAANNSAFDKLYKMAELGVGTMEINARNQIARDRNSIDWFRTALAADQSRAELAMRMQEFELNRQFKNAEIANRYNGLGVGMGSSRATVPQMGTGYGWSPDWGSSAPANSATPPNPPAKKTTMTF